MTKEESQRLQNGHHRKRNAYRCCGLRIYLTDEEGIGQVVQCRYQHADDSGDSHAGNQSRYRGLRHSLVIVFGTMHGYKGLKMNGNQAGVAIERNVFVAEEASQATILRQLLGRTDSNTALCIHQPKFVGYL